MTIICQVCGTANPDGTTYCEGCGVELTGNAASTPNESSVSTPAGTPMPAAAAPLTSPEASSSAEIPALEAVGTGSTGSTGGTLTPTSGDLTYAAEAVMPAPATPGDHADVSAEPVYALDAASMPNPAATAAAEPVPVEPTASNPVLDTPAPSNPVTTPTPPTSTGAAKLGVKKFGVVTGDFIPLQGERLVVGRFDASTGPVDIDLSGLTGQEHISRRHAELYHENGVWHVRDLGSTNGVYVKHQGEASFSPRLQEPAALADGDEIAFGNLMMTFNQG